MLEIFFPDIYIKSIFELPLEKFKRKGIKALIFDIDNTIVPFDVAEADEPTVNYFNYLKKQGFKICLLSNNNKKRVSLFNKRIKALAVYRADKPRIKKLKLAMDIMKSDKKSTILIGDQVFTDIYCGRRAGLTTVLTKPVCSRDQFVTKIKRGAERQILKIYFKRSGINEMY